MESFTFFGGASSFYLPAMYEHEVLPIKQSVYFIVFTHALIFQWFTVQDQPPLGFSQHPVPVGSVSSAKCLLCALRSDGSLNTHISIFQALAGPHFYTWGDHGGILLAIAQGGVTTHLK